MKKHTHTSLLSVALCVTMLSAVSCKRDLSTSTATVSVTVSAEAPLFEGTNTAVGTWEVQLRELFPEIDFDKTKIKSARIDEVVLEYDPDYKVKSAKVEISGRNVSMQKIAFMNNIDENESFVNLLVAEEQKDIHKFLSLDKINVVADVDLAEDLETDFSATVKLKVSINY